MLVVGEVSNVFKLQKFILEFYHPDRSSEARRVNLVVAGEEKGHGPKGGTSASAADDEVCCQAPASPLVSSRRSS